MCTFVCTVYVHACKACLACFDMYLHVHSHENAYTPYVPTIQYCLFPTAYRLVEVLSHRIFDIYLVSKPVNELGQNRTFRIEVCYLMPIWK